MFERLRQAIEAALDAARTPDRRDVALGMREGIAEARAALDGLRDGVANTDRRLTMEKKYLTDAERRGRLAKDVGDEETVRVAERFAEKHREKIGVLENKLTVQRSELALAERELGEMKEQFEKVEGSSAFETAWRELDWAGRASSSSGADDDLLRSQIDRAAREARAEAQLAELKRKMGR